MITVKEHTYIYPPRPQGATPPNQTQYLQELGWIAQLKYNDTRILIKTKPNGRIELWSRHAERLNYNPPTWLEDQLHSILPTGHNIYDGGLLHNKHQAIKDTITIWDILVKQGTHQIGTTYITRYNQLPTGTDNFLHGNHIIGEQLAPNILKPHNHHHNWQELWNTIHSINQPYPQPLIEGLLIKDPNGTLEHGFTEKNNHAWQIRSRLTTGRHKF